MERDRLSRKLAVILHADVVGSTSLVQKNETLAHERIQSAFHQFSETINSYGGITRELRGDALVAEFERASDAVVAALAFQASNTKFNASLDDPIQPQMRMGISMGEVVIADNTITGAGVVLAQRLEQLAEPGKICIQGAAYETVPQRLPFEFKSLGKQQVKGFEEPVRSYTVTLKPGENVPTPEPASEAVAESHKRPKISSLAVGSIVLLVLIGISLTWWQPWVQREEPASIDRMAFRLPDKPSIAVLPFTNMSDDPQQEYFADGMTEDLITDLSKISGLFVIARNSSFSYKGQQVKVRQVAEELGVRYVMEGSVRRVGEQVRINAQLIDAMSGGHLWAERYDGNLADIFSLQDRVTGEIVAALSINLTGQEKINTSKAKTTNPLAYEAFLKGWAHYQRQTPEGFGEARPYLEQAIELDPDYSRAYAALAALYWETHVRHWWPSLNLGTSTGKIKASAYKYRDIALANPTPLALVIAADMLMWRGQHEEAIVQAKRAIKLAPNDAHSLIKLAEILVYAGYPQESLKFGALAARLDPQGLARQLYIQGLAEFGLDRFDKAAETLEKAFETNPEFTKPLTILVAAYGYLGRRDASQILKPYEKEYWASSISTAGPQFPYHFDKDRLRLAEGLRKAGLREFDSF
jgi:adenylate cyclase